MGCFKLPYRVRAGNSASRVRTQQEEPGLEFCNSQVFYALELPNCGPNARCFLKHFP
jgi:hypothetical protein